MRLGYDATTYLPIYLMCNSIACVGTPHQYPPTWAAASRAFGFGNVDIIGFGFGTFYYAQWALQDKIKTNSGHLFSCQIGKSKSTYYRLFIWSEIFTFSWVGVGERVGWDDVRETWNVTLCCRSYSIRVCEYHIMACWFCSRVALYSWQARFINSAFPTAAKYVTSYVPVPRWYPPTIYVRRLTIASLIIM